jgi:hypothetical protein
MFVCIATFSSEVTCHLKIILVPGNLKSQASCALDHFFLPTHVLINHNDLHRLILMGPNRLVLASALCGFGYEDTLFMITLLLSVYYYCS